MIDAVLVTLRGAMADGATGLAVKAAAIAVLRGYAAGRIRTDFVVDRWSLSDAMKPATQPHYAFAPAAGAIAQKTFLATPRESRHAIRFSLETFAADSAVLEDNVTALALAFMQVLDGIEAYSRANAGTIVLLEDPITLRYGSFGGPPTLGGFTADFTVLEQSQE